MLGIREYCSQALAAALYAWVGRLSPTAAIFTGLRSLAGSRGKRVWVAACRWLGRMALA